MIRYCMLYIFCRYVFISTQVIRFCATNQCKTHENNFILLNNISANGENRKDIQKIRYDRRLTEDPADAERFIMC